MRAPRPIALDADLHRWQRQFPEATEIVRLGFRRRATVVGVVTRMRVVPGSSLTLVLEDGTGELEAHWTGRSRLPGVTLGSALRLSAVVGSGTRGRPLLRNPAWTPVAEPFSWPP